MYKPSLTELDHLARDSGQKRSGHFFGVCELSGGVRYPLNTGVGPNVDVELGEDDVGLLRCPQTDHSLRFDGKLRAHLVGAGRIRLDQQDQNLPATGGEIEVGLSGDLIDDVGAFDDFAGFELEQNARRSLLAC